LAELFQKKHDMEHTTLRKVTQYRRDCCAIVNTSNWLQVLDTAEVSQIDQCVRRQLHAIGPLLHAFKVAQQPLELVTHAKVGSTRVRKMPSPTIDISFSASIS
jgi:hypothetical protein